MFVQAKVYIKFAPPTQKVFYCKWRTPIIKLAYGVTGNTSGFGPEESRFEP